MDRLAEGDAQSVSLAYEALAVAPPAPAPESADPAQLAPLPPFDPRATRLEGVLT